MRIRWIGVRTANCGRKKKKKVLQREIRPSHQSE
uniref:Uncharacterized protein n=1 Tax=Siphoviridae sp. ctmIh35 TaxID=2827932 RepID=A0A8S5T9A4_9CAUD|nr:MAG TPA: hypothetical protein [Siphoviridae sp. ctmIh35]